MLNLGCGHRFHSAWINVDIVPQHPSVLRADISRAIPFPDRHFDVVYHSHVIEHLRVDDVDRFLRECRRVLKPGGIIRVATPDLERLCEAYLEKLRAAAVSDHEWLVIEMLDQTVREQSGGAMLEYSGKIPTERSLRARAHRRGRPRAAGVHSCRRAIAGFPAGLRAAPARQGRARDEVVRRRTHCRRWTSADSV